MDYDWPGNVRELKSALEFAFVIAEEGLIDIDQLPPKIAEPERSTTEPARLILKTADHKETRETPILASRPGETTEKRALIEALRQTNGNQSQAARVLGINRVTVWNRMKKYGIDLKKVLTT